MVRLSAQWKKIQIRICMQVCNKIVMMRKLRTQARFLNDFLFRFAIKMRLTSHWIKSVLKEAMKPLWQRGIKLHRSGNWGGKTMCYTLCKKCHYEKWCARLWKLKPESLIYCWACVKEVPVKQAAGLCAHCSSINKSKTQNQRKLHHGMNMWCRHAMKSGSIQETPSF